MISPTPASAFTHLKLRLKQNRTSLVAALLTIWLHVLLLQASALPNWRSMPTPRIEQVVQISLRSNDQVQNALPPVVKTVPVPHQTENKTPVKPAQLAKTEYSEETKNAEIQDIGPGSAVSGNASTQTELAAKPLPEPESSPAAPEAYTLALPDSVELKMTLLRTEPDSNRAPIYGVGALVWSIEGATYKLSIEAGLDMLFTSINLYRLTSEGSINSFGLAPELSTEARRTRAKTATHFHHEDKTVSFSASSAKLPIQDGAQDKASFLMQLASIGKGEPSQFVAGKEIALQVAEEKDLSVFVFTILEKEELSTKLGKFSTWHLVRPARPGAYSSQLDIWFAPDIGWYPIQIRNTESNGTVTTQSVTEIIPKNLPPH